MGAIEKVEVVLPGKGEVTLLPRDHLATGGEGAVYLKNGFVYKIYLDPGGARARGMEEKIRLLSRIRHPWIVSPIDILKDRGSDLVGYYMPVARGVPLVKVFTNAWRDLSGFTDTESVKLVENMRLAVLEAHSIPALIVDGNEMNWLADGVEPRAIDVDSWQIGPFMGTAIMASIFDHHADDLSENTDWFAWGIVTFQVFTGIHPYKGSHPDFKRGDMQERMKANASVFDSRVKLSSAVRDFSAIPGPLADWYEGVFQQGYRGAPPCAAMSAVPAAAPRTLRARAVGSGLLKHQHIMALPGSIRHISTNGIAFYEESSRLRPFDLMRRQAIPSLRNEAADHILKDHAHLVRRGSGYVLLEIDGAGITGSMISGEHDPQPANPDIGRLPYGAEKLILWGERIFALNSQDQLGLAEIALQALGARALLSIKKSWPINVLSMQLFDGFAVLDCLGMPFVVQAEGNSALLIHRAQGLREYRLVNGHGRSSKNLILQGIRRADGRLYRLRMKLSSMEYEIGDCVVIDVAELDIATNARGTGVGIFEDGEVSVWNDFGAAGRTIRDPSITRDMRLFALADGIFYYTGRDVFRLSLN